MENTTNNTQKKVKTRFLPEYLMLMIGDISAERIVMPAWIDL